VTPLHALAVVGAAIVAGAMNVVVGAGTLVTFPTLLALGYPSVTANVSNTIGLIPASAAGAVGYRRELVGRWRLVGRLALLAAVGGIVGGVLLLALPANAFEWAVPVLLFASAGLTAAQPRISAALAKRGPRPAHGGVALAAGVTLTGVYGGYFGAAQGVILLALLGTLLATSLQEANGIKNVLAGVANLVSASLFAVAADVNWAVAGLIAVGSTAGGLIGARYGRRLPSTALRVLIVVIALVAGTWTLGKDVS
jgi:hypothetical protein